MGPKRSSESSDPARGRDRHLHHISVDHRWRRGHERDARRLAARDAHPSRLMVALAVTLVMLLIATNLPLFRYSDGGPMRFAQAREQLERFDLDELIEVMLEAQPEEPEAAPARRSRALEQPPQESTSAAAERWRDPPRMLAAKLAAAAGTAVPTTALPYGADWLAAQTVMLENVDTPPRLQRQRGRHFEIEYPKAARQAGIEGNVILGFIVDLDGRTQDVEVLEPLHPLCDSAAVRAVRGAVFDPGRDNGKIVRVRAKLSILFQLIGY